MLHPRLRKLVFQSGLEEIEDNLKITFWTPEVDVISAFCTLNHNQQEYILKYIHIQMYYIYSYQYY